MKLKLKLMEKGKVVPKRLITFLEKLDDRVSAIENGSMTGSESTEGSLVYRVKALETILGDADDDTIYDDAVLDARISALEDKFRRNLSFTVNNGDSVEPAPIEGAVVTVTTGKTGTTGSAGGCSINGVLDGSYTISVVADGFEEYSGTISVDESHTSFTISLTAISETEGN